MGVVMAKSKSRRDVAIGKFDILATYTRAKSEHVGMSEEDAKVRGMVAAIMGAQLRTGVGHHHHGDEDPFQAQKERAERKKTSSITAESFDHQVADKMGEFFDDVFWPSMKKLLQAGLSDEAVMQAVRIPPRRGAKISGEQFRERVAVALRS
jgi:hypothetical protein